jgi:hypothetical protein
VRINGVPQPQVSHISHLDRPKYHLITGQQFPAEPPASWAVTEHTFEVKEYAATNTATASGQGRERKYGALHARSLGQDAKS